MGESNKGNMIDYICEDDPKNNSTINKKRTRINTKDAFKSYGNLEDYNKEFVAFFKAHRAECLLDFSQKDGHFRV